MGDVLSLCDWLMLECNISSAEWKKMDKTRRMELRNEYRDYLKEHSAIK